MNDLEKLKEMVKVQCSNGNWDYDPYMHGMANGMIYCLSLLEHKEPKFLKAPKVWLKDLPGRKVPLGEFTIDSIKATAISVGAQKDE